jgi:hypothetical protein
VTRKIWQPCPGSPHRAVFLASTPQPRRRHLATAIPLSGENQALGKMREKRQNTKDESFRQENSLLETERSPVLWN